MVSDPILGAARSWLTSHQDSDAPLPAVLCAAAEWESGLLEVVDLAS
jgi:hypothetical protein